MTSLSQWISDNRVSPRFYYYGSALRSFARMERAAAAGEATVISTHRSKSIVLPVVEFKVDDRVILLRDNFHDVAFSVESETPIETDFPFNEDHDVYACYYQGFPEDRVYGSWQTDPTRFSGRLYWDEARLWSLFGLEPPK